MKPSTQQQAMQLQQLFIQAQQALRLQQFETAEVLFRRILVFAPQALEARNGLAIALASTQRFALATKEFRIILKARPDHAPTHHNLANALYEQALLQEALRHFQSAIRIDPSLSMAQLHMGQCLRKLNRPVDAIEHYKRALDLDRGNHFALHALGLAYQAINDLPRALECFEKACGLKPDVGDYHFSFGMALKDAQLSFEACDELQKACDLLPAPGIAALALSEILKSTKRNEEALKSLKLAQSSFPDRADIYCQIGNIYILLGDIDNALKSFQHGLDIDSHNMFGLIGMGEATLYAGLVEQANLIANQLIEHYPDKPNGYILKSQSQRILDKNLPDKLHMLLKQPKLAEEERIAVEFALGKSYEDLKVTDEAIKHYINGNRIKNSRLEYDPAQEIEFFESTQAIFNKDFFSGRTDWALDTDLPIFIIGMPRSGTTLTEQIISSHPEVFGAGEVSYWGNLAANLSTRIRSTATYFECLSQLKRQQAQELAKEYLALLNKISSSANLKHITDKLPHNFLQVGIISTLFPNARIIHTKRNSMDNCLSIFFQNFSAYHPYAYSMHNIARHYRHYEQLMSHWHETLPGRIFDIQYEDLIAEPETWSKKLIGHIGLEWDDACLAPHKLERSVKTASYWQVRQPIYKTSVEKWRAYEPYLDELKQGLGLD